MLKKLVLLLQLPLLAAAQLSGTLTVPGSYASLNAALSAINQQGVNGALTVVVAATHTEVVPNGGYSLYVGGTAQNILLIKSSSINQRPLLIAPSSGNRTPSSATQDGIWRLIGCDFVTIDGFELRDNNQQAPQTMEFGFGLFKASNNNGCHFVTIKNCLIQLHQLNNASGNLPACDGARGIEVVNALVDAHTTSLQVTSPAGSHSDNWFHSNVIKQCNYGITLMGYTDSAPFVNSDWRNRIGGVSAAFSNTIIDFGGGGSNPAAAIRAQFQYSLSVANNSLVSSTSSLNLHLGTLRGVFLNQAPEASAEVESNTITVKGAGTSAQLVAIENQFGSQGNSNLVLLQNNLIENCSHQNASSGSFYGIYNAASAASITVAGNRFSNNSSAAQNGSNYLIYSNATVSDRLNIVGNYLQYRFEGNAVYTGYFACINVVSAAASCSVSISNNEFGNIVHRPNAGTGALHFIANTSDLAHLTISFNSWKNLHLNHSGPQYCIYNASSTASLLTVSSNTVSNYHRMVAGNFYFYYGNSTSPPTATHSFTSNCLNTISSESGTGNFYGIANTEGNQSPFPKKDIAFNDIRKIRFSGTGNLYALFLSDFGDAGTGQGSTVSDNLIAELSASDNVYGIYLNSSYSPNFMASVHNNTICSLQSSGANTYGAYISSNNAGLQFCRNKLYEITSTASSGSVCGLYAASTGTYLVHHNLIGQLFAPNASGSNRVNGMHFSTGSSIKVYYNTVRINGSSSGANFGTNAIFSSSTPTLDLRNNLLINTSTPTGSGVACVFRRSNTTLSTYALSSNNNIFYAGSPAPNSLIFSNGSTSYSLFSQFQAAISPREISSTTQNQIFQSTTGAHPYFLHVTNNVSTAVESGGASIATYSTDVDAELRQGAIGYVGGGTAPDIDADELQVISSPCSSALPATITALSNTVCTNSNVQLQAGLATCGSGISYQWKVATTLSGPFLSVNSGTGATSPDYAVGALSSGVYFFQLQTSCASVTQVAVSNISSVTISPSPSITVTSTNQVCVGADFTLSTSGQANQFYWRGPAAFTSTSPTLHILNVPTYASGVYSLAASLGPCTAATQTLLLSVIQVVANVTANPPSICSGGASTLITSGNASSYVWNSTVFGPTLAVYPSQTSTYSVLAIGAANCVQTKTISVSVVNPTIQAMNGVICSPANTGTFGVQTFSNAFISWYTNTQTLVPFAYGPILSVSSQSTISYFARAALLNSLSVQSNLTGTNQSSAIMFDVLPQTNFVLHDLDLHLTASTSATVTVWNRVGSYINFTNTTNGWNLVSSATLQAQGAGSLSSFSAPLSLPFTGAQIQALCISVNGASLLTSFSNSSSTTWGNAPFQLSAGLGGTAFSVGGAPIFFEGGFNVRNESCSSALSSVSVNVASANQLTLSPSAATICPNQSLSISASGASSYLWSTSNTGSVLTIYPSAAQVVSVLGTNQLGCTSTASVSVSTHSLSPIIIESSAQSVCPNSALSFTASGVSSYTWNSGPNGAHITVYPPSQTTFTVYGTNASGCRSQQTVSAITRTVPLIQISPFHSTICKGSQVLLKAQGALSYTWLPSGALGDTNTVQPVVNSVYNVIGTGINTCTNIAYANLLVDECTLLPTEQPSRKIEVLYKYEEKLVLIKAASPVHCILRDVQGKLVLNETCQNQNMTIDLSHFTTGVYLLQIIYEQQYICRKLVLD